MVETLKYIFFFMGIVVAQVLVIDNMQFLGYLSPMIYIYFIISLPVQLPRWVELLIAFGLGITIDIFSDTLGINIFATVFVAFFRHHIISFYTTLEEGYQIVPSFQNFGISSYVKYVVTIVLLHHIALFLIEAFSFVNIFLLIPRIVASSVVTILIILALQLLTRR